MVSRGRLVAAVLVPLPNPGESEDNIEIMEVKSGQQTWEGPKLSLLSPFDEFHVL